MTAASPGFCQAVDHAVTVVCAFQGHLALDPERARRDCQDALYSLEHLLGRGASLDRGQRMRLHVKAQELEESDPVLARRILDVVRQSKLPIEVRDFHGHDALDEVDDPYFDDERFLALGEPVSDHGVRQWLKEELRDNEQFERSDAKDWRESRRSFGREAAADRRVCRKARQRSRDRVTFE